MKSYIINLTISLTFFSLYPQEIQQIVPTYLQQNLSAKKAIEVFHKSIGCFYKAPSHCSNPELEQHKCEFILGSINTENLLKLRKQLSRYEMGALCALKKSNDQQLTLQDQLDLWFWEGELNKKHCPTTVTSQPSKHSA